MSYTGILIWCPQRPFTLGLCMVMLCGCHVILKAILLCFCRGSRYKKTPTCQQQSPLCVFIADWNKNKKSIRAHLISLPYCLALWPLTHTHGLSKPSLLRNRSLPVPNLTRVSGGAAAVIPRCLLRRERKEAETARLFFFFPTRVLRHAAPISYCRPRESRLLDAPIAHR